MPFGSGEFVEGALHHRAADALRDFRQRGWRSSGRGRVATAKGIWKMLGA